MNFTKVLLTLAAVIGVTFAGLSIGSSSSKDEVVLTEDNHVIFSGKVDAQSVSRAQVQLASLSSKLPDSAIIYLIIDSPGGSVMAGNQFIDFAQALPQKIKTIPLFAASMGYHMAQSFHERLALPSTTLMSHRASLGGIGGQIPGEFESRLNNIKNILTEMDQFVASRVGISLEEYKAQIHDELWLTGREAVTRKHADRLIKAVCDKSLLSGNRVESVNTIFGPVQVEMSRCPLINGPISVKFGRTEVPAGHANIPQELLMREVLKARRGVSMEF